MIRVNDATIRFNKGRCAHRESTSNRATVSAWGTPVSPAADSLFPRRPALTEVRLRLPRLSRALRSSLEGRLNYGCWFFPAAGSGIWLPLGRTYITHTKSGGSLASLKAAWRANTTIEHNESEKIVAPHGEVMPSYAARLGYDTVQAQFNNMGSMAETVAVSAPCMAREGRPGLGACVPLELRAGARAERRCECDSDVKGFTALQCVGVADGATARAI